jgi:hypothetical protein
MDNFCTIYESLHSLLPEHWEVPEVEIESWFPVPPVYIGQI